ncbi:ABC transporter ATP-binding protein [Novosphingobium sp. RD2P27]|uniref:ABC transporter ATP-binding protein n=1 Tax=Novosphingobium kalidii TaxID=3230299 RepID=A0ABV2D391_9SPHN
MAAKIGFRQATTWLAEIVGPDSAYVRLGLVYTVAISLLTLATPISVQLLINSVVQTALPAPLWTLSLVLLLLLLLVAGISALRTYLMALFERRLFARVVAETTIRAVHAQNPFFADANRSDLFNRFFDMVVVQKSVPSLVIGAFTILLQGVVAIVITSFYHPFFLAFNAILVSILLALWLIWRGGALTGTVALSHAKHEAARWLESVGGSNGFYKSDRHFQFAMERSEQVTAAYIGAHKRYFRYSFAQTLGCLALYAVASAALLALGGHLILQGELSIGQLVAAELILSSVFYGISQLGWYLDTFYDLVASSEELSLLFSIPQEPANASGQAPANGAISMRNVCLGASRFDLEVASGERLVIVAEQEVEHSLALLLKRHAVPAHGILSIGAADLGSLNLFALRSAVTVLDRPTIVEVTIRQYLTLAAPNAPSGALLEAVDVVGLTERIAKLDGGLDTLLGSSGWPLSIGEVMALKLAASLLTRPRVLMLSSLFDLLPVERLERALASLGESGTTILLLTRRPEAIRLDGFLWLGRAEQRRFEECSELSAHLTQREASHVQPA